MSGYFDERVSTGIKDPLHAKAVVFQQGDAKAALVFCDICYLSRDTVVKARAAASRLTGIPADHIAVAATHSHTGPLYYGAMRDHFHDRSIKRLGADPYEKVDYAAQLPHRIAQAIAQANGNVGPAAVHAGYVREGRLSFNRRYFMRDGSVRFNPGLQNPDIVRPAGPIDPEIGVLSFTRAGVAKPFAALAVFALHLDTTSGTKYSADYPKFAEDVLRESLGGDFNLLFGAGTCGDINHIDVNAADVRKAEDIGRVLGRTLASALSGNHLKPIGAPALAVRTATVDVTLQSYSPQAMAEAEKNLDLIGGRELPFLKQVETYKIASLGEYKSRTLPLEVQAFRLSRDTAVVTLPSEIFVELGLAIKAASPFRTTIVVELANDSLAYIPTKKAFAEGSYEIVNSRVQPGAGEQLVEAAVRLLKELQ
jgi:hypothetical protein